MRNAALLVVSAEVRNRHQRQTHVMAGRRGAKLVGVRTAGTTNPSALPARSRGLSSGRVGRNLMIVSRNAFGTPITT